MNKEIEEMMLAVPQKIIAYDGNPAGQHLYGEHRQEIAEALYNAGYRKLSKDSVVLSKEEHEILVKTAIDKISSGFMVEAVSTEEQVKQAVKEFAEKLKKKVHNYYPSIDSYCTSKHVILIKDIDELLKEFLK
jgi:TusA-related sulfurtransferase